MNAPFAADDRALTQRFEQAYGEITALGTPADADAAAASFKPERASAFAMNFAGASAVTICLFNRQIRRIECGNFRAELDVNRYGVGSARVKVLEGDIDAFLLRIEGLAKEARRRNAAIPLVA